MEPARPSGQASKHHYAESRGKEPAARHKKWVASIYDFGASKSAAAESSSISSRAENTTPQPLVGTERSLQPVQCSLSTVFLQGGIIGAGIHVKPDIALRSQDSVLFYVHSAFVMQTCINDSTALFGGLVGDHAVAVAETAEVLNLLLHAIYFMPCLHYLPSFAVLERVVEVLAGASRDLLKLCIESSSPLALALLAQAPSHAIELYALAGFHDVPDLATSVSPFLLSFDLSQLTDSISHRIGSLYLKKLFFLHLGRREALKRSLAVLPDSHGGCDDHNQQRLREAWMHAMATLAGDKTTVDLSPSTLNLTFAIAGRMLECSPCKKAWDVRVQSMVEEWSAVKRTI